MVYYNAEQKAEKLIMYAIAQAATLSDAVTAFNNVSLQIKNKIYVELCVLIDGELL